MTKQNLLICNLKTNIGKPVDPFASDRRMHSTFESGGIFVDPDIDYVNLFPDTDFFGGLYTDSYAYKISRLYMKYILTKVII